MPSTPRSRGWAKAVVAVAATTAASLACSTDDTAESAATCRTAGDPAFEIERDGDRLVVTERRADGERSEAAELSDGPDDDVPVFATMRQDGSTITAIVVSHRPFGEVRLAPQGAVLSPLDCEVEGVEGIVGGQVELADRVDHEDLELVVAYADGIADTVVISLASLRDGVGPLAVSYLEP